MTTSQWSRVVALAMACLACSRQQAETPPPETPRAAATARSRFSREARVEEALARAPQLSRAAAELLVESSERHGGVWGDPADASLVEANRGFAQMPPADLSELGGLFGEAYATLSAADRAAVESYVERVRRGDATANDERPRTLLGQAVKSLPEARRGRLQLLLEAAIRAGLETERRTALAQGQPAVAPPPETLAAWASRSNDRTSYHRPAQAYATPTPDYDAEDARLREQGAYYKAQLESLEMQVRYAERGVESARDGIDSARQVPLSKRPMGDPSVAYAEKRLVDAQEELRRARNALEDLHTKIRRERIPMNYVQ